MSAALVVIQIPITNVPRAGTVGICPLCFDAMVFPRSDGPFVYRHVFCRSGHTFLLHDPDIGPPWVELARSEVEQLRQANEHLTEKAERATGRASELHERLRASESARRAAEPTTAAPGSIRVRVEVAAPVEVTTLGNSLPRVIPATVVEVVLTPEELQEAARSKLMAERAMYPSGYVTLPDTLCDEDVLRLQKEFQREWLSNHAFPPLLITGDMGPLPDIESHS